MRAPGRNELLAAAIVAVVAGGVLGRMHPRGARVLRTDTSEAGSDIGPDTDAFVDARGARADDAFVGPHGDGGADAADGDGAFGGFTVDDDRLPEPPDPTTTDLETLLALIPIDVRDEASLTIARRWLGPRSNHASQGNPDISTHSISRAQCIAGLHGVVLQTRRDREICTGPWEVPIHTGDPTKAKTCIDVFEYPNRPCVLPFVFSHPIAAKQLCSLEGKRLCTQEEWNVACAADPEGSGTERKYAYGGELDLSVCHTGKGKSAKCDVDHALWKSCPSDTVPAGSYPQCRSRLGVYDQHGNVAEAMTRLEKGVNYVQLKGSAFFYDGEMYADHCRYDPRWHVDPVDESFHTNYHLGFRCCRSVVPLDERGDASVDAPAPVPKPKPKPDASSEEDEPLPTIGPSNPPVAPAEPSTPQVPPAEDDPYADPTEG